MTTPQPPTVLAPWRVEVDRDEHLIHVYDAADTSVMSWESDYFDEQTQALAQFVVDAVNASAALNDVESSNPAPTYCMLCGGALPHDTPDSRHVAAYEALVAEGRALADSLFATPALNAEAARESERPAQHTLACLSGEHILVCAKCAAPTSPPASPYYECAVCTFWFATIPDFDAHRHDCAPTSPPAEPTR